MARYGRSRQALVALACAAVLGASTQRAHAEATRAHGSPTAAAPKAAASASKPAAKAPAHKASATTTAKSNARPARTSEAAVRRNVAGGPTVDDAILGVESPELRALRDAERELFPPAVPAPGQPWPTDLPSPLSSTPDRPRVHASGLPPAPLASRPPEATESGKDLAWLTQLQMPDLPVRWDPRLVRYLEFFKDDPRGRSTFTSMYRRSGRYRELIRRTLRRKGVPEDLTWVAMVESGFDPTVRSPVGAVGLWQFMPETGKSYGLSQDRWLDQRFNVQAATEAAGEYLSDLHRRFGSWELALASYNMGYGGVSSLVRRYNTNDFWALSHTEGALPWETSLYVPKILALGIVTRNLAAFGYAEVQTDPPLEVDEVHVAPGTTLATVAAAAGCTTKDLEALNPELRAARVPPPATPGGDADGVPQALPVKVPAGKGAACTQALARAKKEPPAYERYVVRFGETLDQIAAARKVTAAKLVEMNGMSPGEAVRGGTVLLVPKGDGPPAPSTIGGASAGAPTASNGAKTTIVVPGDVFAYPDRRRVFYRVLAGDTLREIATTFHVPVDDLRRWNNLDPTARLMEGMSLQAFVPAGADLSHVVVLEEPEVNVLAVGSDEFFSHLEALKGYKRITVAAKSGDTLETVGKRYNVAAKVMERANGRGRSEPLKEGETVVVYVPSTAPGASGTPGIAAAQGPEPNGPLPAPPVPDLLP